MKSLILLSGGMDSTLCLALAREQGQEILCLGIDYGARHNRPELRAAAAVAAHYETPFEAVRLRFPRNWGGSLMDKKSRRLNGAATVVSGRNAVLFGLAAGYAQDHGCERVVVGCNATDHADFPDCRKGFLSLLSLAFEGAYGVTVDAPLALLTKAEIVARGTALGVPWDLTYSCYAGTEPPCRVCGACWARQQGFLNAQLAEERPGWLGMRERQAVELVQVGAGGGPPLRRAVGGGDEHA
jgi:7-cyano-7-deazaguanine synthase